MSWQNILKSELTGEEKEAYELLLEYGEISIYPSLLYNLSNIIRRGSTGDKVPLSLEEPFSVFNQQLIKYKDALENLASKTDKVASEYHYDPYLSYFDEMMITIKPYERGAYTVYLTNESQREAAKRKHKGKKYLTEEYRLMLARELSQGQRKRRKAKKTK